MPHRGRPNLGRANRTSLQSIIKPLQQTHRRDLRNAAHRPGVNNTRRRGGRIIITQRERQLGEQGYRKRAEKYSAHADNAKRQDKDQHWHHQGKDS